MDQPEPTSGDNTPPVVPTPEQSAAPQPTPTAPPAPAVPAFVQGLSQASSSSTALTLTQPVQDGDLLVGIFSGSSTMTISDSLNGAWIKASASGATAVWYFAGSKAGSVTVTMTAHGSTNTSQTIAEFSGVAATTSLTTSACAGGSSKQASAGPITTSTSNELVFAGVASTSQVTVSPVTAGDFTPTLRNSVSNGSGTSGDEDATVASASASAVTPSFALSRSVSWTACAASFRAA
jgi:hypothetical protein